MNTKTLRRNSLILLLGLAALWTAPALRAEPPASSATNGDATIFFKKEK